jgi:hypothetical protein
LRQKSEVGQNQNLELIRVLSQGDLLQTCDPSVVVFVVLLPGELAPTVFV